jgi:hypothetical protein
MARCPGGSYHRDAPSPTGSVLGLASNRHDAHRAPLAFRAIMTLPQPTAFTALLRGSDGECPCFRRRFADDG